MVNLMAKLSLCKNTMASRQRKLPIINANGDCSEVRGEEEFDEEGNEEVDGDEVEEGEEECVGEGETEEEAIVDVEVEEEEEEGAAEESEGFNKELTSDCEPTFDNSG